MRFVFICTALIVAFAGTSVSARPALAPYTHEEGFESGSVGPWSSYPPSQDTAYDPTIGVRSVETGGKALFREVTPDYAGDCLFGVRRKLDLYVGSGSMLSFRAYIRSEWPAEGVRLKLGFADGTSVEKTLPLEHASAWNDVRVNLGEFAGSGAPRQLTAVAFVAVCPGAVPENPLRFGVDEVRVTGFRTQEWDFSAPRVHRLDEWTDAIAAKHYRDGGVITISGNPPFTPRGVLVRVNRALTGDRGGIFKMKKTGGTWSVSIPITAKSHLGPGFWRATVLTTTQSGETLSSTLVFLVKRSDAPKENPRLIMEPGDAPKILAKAASGRLKTVWEGMRRSAVTARDKSRDEDFVSTLDSYGDDANWLDTYRDYIRAIRVPSGYIRSNGVVYGLTKDAEAGKAASRALVRMAAWPSFVHPHILKEGQFTYWPVGQMLADLAIGYDMARSGMTPEDRRIVARALHANGVTGVFNEYVRDDRVSSATSNWIGDVTGGGILCALATLNDLPEEESEPYLSGMILKLDRLIENAFDRDGAYGEGYAYLNHAMECINVAAPALDRTFGVEFPAKLRTGYRFLLYQTNSGSRAVYDYGDTNDRLGGLSSFSSTLARTRDPHLKWLYDLAPGSRDVDLFFGDESIPSRSPDDLPKAVHFRDTGTVVFRSGFAPEDFAFVFRCGPFSNHQHFDQGSFFLADRGEEFIVEAGKTDYYADPWYRKLFIQPLGHNCVLLDGDPESQRAGDFRTDVPAWHDYAAITDFLVFDGGGFASGRLDPLYKGKIGSLRRSVLYLAPRTVVLIDEAAGPRGVTTADLLFHAPRLGDLSVRGNTTMVIRPNGTLTIRTIAPDACRAEVKTRPLSIAEFADTSAANEKRGYLQVSADVGNTPLTVVNVLTTDEPALAALNAAREASSTGFVYGGVRYIVNTTGGKRFTEGGAGTDALVHAIRPDGFTALRASVLVRNGKTILKSDRPVNVDIRGEGSKKVTYAVSGSVDITLAASARPKRVMVNGQLSRAWTYDAKSGLRLSLEPGKGTVVIR